MYWVIQSNLTHGRDVQELPPILERAGIPYSLHKVVPFVGDIEPDVNPEGNVIVIGAYSLRNLAKRKGWIPGSFDLADLTYEEHFAHWGAYMLNRDAIFCTFEDAPKHFHAERLFMRPVVDSKFFSGAVISREELLHWHHKVLELKEDDGSNLRGSTMVLLATLKNIQREYRIWVVDGRVVTASLYRQGYNVIYCSDVEPMILDFAQARADEWSPQRAYVLDIALTPAGLHIIETNTLNAAGLYAADISKLVAAIEDMSFPVLDNVPVTR